MIQNQVTGKAPVAVPVPTDRQGLTKVEAFTYRIDHQVRDNSLMMNPGFSGVEGAAGGTLKLDSSGAAPILLAVLAVVIFAMKQPVSRPNGPIAARRG